MLSFAAKAADASFPYLSSNPHVLVVAVSKCNFAPDFNNGNALSVTLKRLRFGYF
jgi:hypothetical protein